jgi:hypothetical protein
VTCDSHLATTFDRQLRRAPADESCQGCKSGGVARDHRRAVCLPVPGLRPMSSASTGHGSPPRRWRSSCTSSARRPCIEAREGRPRRVTGMISPLQVGPAPRMGIDAGCLILPEEIETRQPVARSWPVVDDDLTCPAISHPRYAGRPRTSNRSRRGAQTQAFATEDALGVARACGSPSSTRE